MVKSRTELMVDAVKIRMGILDSLHHLGAGHVGGAMSMADLLAVLYGGVMRVDPARPNWEERDWLVVSKGHSGPALYAALALNGFFPYEMLSTMNTGGTRLPSHCDRNKTPGVDMSTGSLGQGMSTAIGTAWGNRQQGRASRTYLVLGDGELQEGQVWEGALFAAQQKLDNLYAFVDWNKQQLDGYVETICDLGEIAEKFAAFGWDAQTCDGGDPQAILDAIRQAETVSGKPHMIVLDTQKGRGCAFAEGVLYNHHMKFTQEQWETAMARLREELAALTGGEESHG